SHRDLPSFPTRRSSDLARMGQRAVAARDGEATGDGQPAGRVEASPFLIVAPTSVLPNWAAEAARFTPDLKVVTIGDTLARRGQRSEEHTSELQSPYDLV